MSRSDQIRTLLSTGHGFASLEGQIATCKYTSTSMALYSDLRNASSYKSQDGAQNEGVANAQNPSRKRSVGGERTVAPNQSMLDEATVSPTSLFVVVCAPPSHKRRVVLVRVLNVLWLSSRASLMSVYFTLMAGNRHLQSKAPAHGPRFAFASARCGSLYHCQECAR